jgi:CPA2 family monovalent cation:H+ antiporter-2
VVLPDVFSNQMAVRNLRRANSDLVILARAHSEWEREILLQEGANDVIQPEAEAGLQVVREVITHMEIPDDVVEEYLEAVFTAYNGYGAAGVWRILAVPQVREFL